MAQVILRNNDNLVQVDELKDAASGGAFLNAATVAVNFYDKAGTLIAGPITLTYVAASSGKYEGILPSTTVLAEDQRVRVVITATEGSLDAEWDEVVTVQKRSLAA